MKSRLLPLVASALLIATVACGGDDDDATQPAELQTLNVLIDGELFAAVNGGATQSGSTVTLSGISAAGGIVRTLTIVIPSAATGTVQIGGAGSPTITYAEQPSGGALLQWAAGEGAGSGTIVLTELSAARAIGTIIANLPPVTATGATSARVLTGGTFKLTF
jgi:hypothetical protein